MRTPNYIKSQILCNEDYEGQSIERMIEKFLNEGTPIESISPTIYTLRSEGVRPEYDIRTDKWEIAQEAMGRVTDKYHEARKQSQLKYANKKAENNNENGSGEAA